MPIVLWQFFVFVVRWVVANPSKAVLLEVGVEGFAGIENGLIKRFRDAMAAMVNQLSGGEFRVAGDDFESWRKLKIAMSREIAGRSGVVLRDITDKKMVMEDLSEFALQMMEAKTGYRVSSLTNTESLRADFVKIGVGLVGERTGIVLTNPGDIEAIKADLLAWGRVEIMSQISGDLETVLNAEHVNGVSLMSYMKQVTGRDIKPSELLRGVQAVAMGSYPEAEAMVEVVTKASRRRLQNKLNQRIFRERHKKGSPFYDGGGVSVYVPKGGSATIIRG